MNIAELSANLRAHLSLAQKLLDLVQRENQALNSSGNGSRIEFDAGRKALLPELEHSLVNLRANRQEWHRLDPVQRQNFPEVNALIRASQEISNKILLLDRENEQLLLRRGLLPPQMLPSTQQQRPHFVADLYRRNIGK
ncbi:MAG TPA: hypothetical protein VGE41_07620 [Verrucomicrobiae bacterium]|jgi:hypothetical protein